MLSGLSVDVEFLITLLNVTFGAIILTIFYWILRDRLNLSKGYSFIGTTLPAFSYGMWFYSVSIEVHTIPIAFLMLTFYLLLSGAGNRNKYYLVGLTHGTAIIFYQADALFFWVILAAAWYEYRQTNGSVFKKMSQYAASCMPVVIIPYLVVVLKVFKLNSMETIWHWFTLYAHAPVCWNTFSFSTLLKATIGFGRAVIGLNFAFAIPELLTLIDKVCAGHWLMDETYLVRNLSKNTAWFLVFLSVLFCVGLIFSMVKPGRKKYLVSQKKKTALLLAAVWFVSYAIFFFFWVADNAEFWISQSLCFWLILLVLWSTGKNPDGQEKKSNIYLIASISVLIFIINYFGSIRFFQDKDNDFFYQKIVPLVDIVEPKDLIVVGPATHVTGHASLSWNTTSMYRYLLWYTKASVLDLEVMYERLGANADNRLVRQMREIIDRVLSGGNRVFVYHRATKAQKEIIQTFGPGVVEFNKQVWSGYNDKWRKVEFESSSVYILDPGGLKRAD